MSSFLTKMVKQAKYSLIVAYLNVLFVIMVVVIAIYIAAFSTNQSIVMWSSHFEYDGPWSDAGLGCSVDCLKEDYGDKKIELPKVNSTIAEVKRSRHDTNNEIAKITAQREVVQNRINSLQNKLRLREIEVHGVADNAKMRSTALIAGIMRFIVISIAFFISRILSGYARYYFRLAHHLVMIANAFLLAGQDLDDVSELVGLISLLSGNVGFKEIPNAPAKSILGMFLTKSKSIEPGSIKMP